MKTKRFFGLVSRVREPSTWAGLSVLALLLGAPADTIDTMGQIVGGVAAVGAVILPEINRTGGGDGA